MMYSVFVLFTCKPITSAVSSILSSSSCVCFNGISTIIVTAVCLLPVFQRNLFEYVGRALVLPCPHIGLLTYLLLWRYSICFIISVSFPQWIESKALLKSTMVRTAGKFFDLMPSTSHLQVDLFDGNHLASYVVLA